MYYRPVSGLQFFTGHKLFDRMKLPGVIGIIGLIGASIFYSIVTNAQTSNPYHQIKDEIVGIWGITEEKHIGKWIPYTNPQHFIEFTESNRFSKTYVQDTDSIIFLGNFKFMNDSVLVLYDVFATDGRGSGPQESDTIKLHTLGNGVLEIWEDWERILWRKGVKKWGHKKRYRRLTEDEKADIQAVKAKILSNYSERSSKEGENK